MTDSKMQEKPDYLKPIFENFPKELTELDQWVVWKAKWDNDRGKWTKPLYNPVTGGYAKSNTPATWSSFEVAKKAYKSGNFDGVGFVLTAGDPIVGVDLDHILTQEGRIEDKAKAIIDTMQTYTEKSPSGDGVRLFATGKLPPSGRKKGNYELYESGRYLTLTGHRMNELGIESRQSEIEEVHNIIFGKSQESIPNLPPVSVNPTDLSDSDLWNKMFIAKNGNAIRDLYQGNTAGYESHSDADMVLCGHLAYWTGRDAVKMDSMFRESGLIRDKWDKKHYANNQTYGQHTIEKAIANCQQTYDPEYRKTSYQNQTQERKEPPVEIPNDDKLSEISRKILEKKERTSFNTGLLPPVLDEYIRGLSKSTSADPTMITQSVLCMLSSMIGKRVYIPYPNYFQDLYPNLWCLTINESGSFKTTALNLGSRIAKYKRDEIIHEIKMLKKEISSLEKPKKDDLKKYENLIREKHKESPILPERTTAEGLIDRLDTNGGAEYAGGQIICSEFGEWVQNLSKTHNNGYKQFLTGLYDVTFPYEYKTRTYGDQIIERPFITLNAVSTLEWVSKDISQDDVSSGFFARFLLFYPPTQKVIPPALPTYQNQDYIHIEDEIKAILDKIREVENFREYRLSESARAIFNHIHKQIYEKMDNLPDNLSKKLQPYIKRWSPYVLKIASLFQPFFNFDSQEIEDNAVMSAFEVVNYCINSTISLFESELGESEQQKKQRLVTEYIAKQKGKITRGKLITSKTLSGGTLEYDNVLNALIDGGLIEVTQKEKKKEWVYFLL